MSAQAPELACFSDVIATRLDSAIVNTQAHGDESGHVQPWPPRLRTAVVHEWIDAYAGSEQVYEQLAQLFPEGDLFALSRRPGIDLEVGGRAIRTTMLDRPWWRAHRALSLPLMPLAWQQLGGSSYELVVTSHHAFANTNRLAAPGGVQLSYVHSPARYVWSPEVDRRGSGARLALARAVLRRVDLRSLRRVDAIAANSSAVAKRVERFWGREATVIHPPVRVEYFAAPPAEEHHRREVGYILGVGRWIPYKNLHLVIEAASLVERPVVIAGGGPDRSRIVAAAERACVPVELVENPTDEQLRRLYRNAGCLVFPTIEDFGMVPVEAQAAGTPVVGPAQAGCLDTVVDGVTGILTDTLAPAQLAEGIAEAVDLDRQACTTHAQRFSASAFRDAFARWCSFFI